MNDFSTQRKWCPSCEAYVTYLQSAKHAYCTECDTPVRLFETPVEPGFHKFDELDFEVDEGIPSYLDFAGA